MGLSGNVWKYWLYVLSQRRNFIPILSIYFLTLPDTTAQQIGLYSGAGYLAGFLLEIPSGYISDRWGHKNAMVVAKVCMLFSSVAFLVAGSGTAFAFFIIGSVLLSASIALDSGASQALMHNTLLTLERDYTQAMSRIKGTVSLVSIPFILLLPLLTELSLVLPIQAWVLMDVAGLAAVIAMLAPSRHGSSEPRPGELWTAVKVAAGSGFVAFTLFSAGIRAVLLTESPYRYVYLEALGLPIIFMGATMAASRAVWFIVAHYAHSIERRISIRGLMQIEIFLFPAVLVLAALSSDPWVVVGLLALLVGYSWGRREIIVHHLLRTYVPANLKASILSVHGQAKTILAGIAALLIAPIMELSYAIGYAVLGLGLFTLLVASYAFSRERTLP